MPIRIAAIGVGHWHSLHDAAYLKTLAKLPQARLVGVQDPDAGMAAGRAQELGGPPAFTDFREMLASTRPDFVVALGRPSAMAGIAHHLLDESYPFLMEKPMGLHAREVQGIAEKAAARKAFAAEPLATVALRDALARWQRGEPPATGPEDCYRAMRVVDRTYEVARSGYA